MAKSEARHHHYIPQCYLRGFAMPGRGKHPQITVSNIVHRTQYETTSRNIGGKRDFNRINVSGANPNDLEHGYASFEGELAESLANIRKTNTFAGKDRDRVLNLIALLAVRSPQMREHLRKFHESVSKHIMDVALSRKEIWDSQIRNLPPDLQGKNRVSYEQMKDFHKRDEYAIGISQDYQIGQELKMLDVILPLLFARKWMMFVSDDTTGQFVASDRAVLLQWNEPETVPLMLRDSPGYGMRETRVFFPLDRHRMLVGGFEDQDIVLSTSTEWLSITNTITCCNSYESFFSAGRTISYAGADKRFYRDGRIFDRLLKLPPNTEGAKP